MKRIIFAALCALIMGCAGAGNGISDEEARLLEPDDFGRLSSANGGEFLLGQRLENTNVLIDDCGTEWNGLIEVIVDNDMAASTQIRIVTPNKNEVAEYRTELQIESTSYEAGPSDPVHTTEYLPFGRCGYYLFVAHFIIDGRGQWVKMHLHEEGREEIVAEHYLRMLVMERLDAQTSMYVYQAVDAFGPHSTRIEDFFACARPRI